MVTGEEAGFSGDSQSAVVLTVVWGVGVSFTVVPPGSNHDPCHAGGQDILWADTRRRHRMVDRREDSGMRERFWLFQFLSFIDFIKYMLI